MNSNRLTVQFPIVILVLVFLNSFKETVFFKDHISSINRYFGYFQAEPENDFLFVLEYKIIKGLGFNEKIHELYELKKWDALNNYLKKNVIIKGVGRELIFDELWKENQGKDKSSTSPKTLIAQ